MSTPSPKRPVYIRIWPFYIIAAGLIFAVSQGWHTSLKPQALAENAVYLNDLVSNNFVKVLAAYVGIYILATVFLIPGSVLTIAAGFLFGLAVGVPAAVAGASIGAMSIFLIAKTSLGDVMRAKAGGFLSKMETGFQKNQLSYMFSTRLIPAIPFSFANIGPALLGARFRDFAISTIFGIIPATTAYVWLGAAAKGTLLDAAQRGETQDAGALFSSLASNFLPALIALGAVSLIPIIYNRYKAKKAKTQTQ